MLFSMNARTSLTAANSNADPGRLPEKTLLALCVCFPVDSGGLLLPLLLIVSSRCVDCTCYVISLPYQVCEE